MNNIIFASVISEIQQSPMFMTVKAVICDTPEANLNGAKVTEAFVNEVVKNEKRYVGLPLYADVKALTRGEFDRPGHLYDVKTGEFHSTQIGSFYKFEKEEFENGYHLIGYARIPKRNKKLSNNIAELFANGKLSFSFEVAEENDDGTITIDASENNYLEGTAIVTYPACENAVALELVAQKAEESANADETRKGECEMAEVENKAEVVETEAAQPELAEQEVKDEVAETTETEEKTEETAAETTEDENASCKKEKENAEETSTAEVYVRETVTESKETHAFDTETGKSVHQNVVVQTTTEDAVEGTLVQSDDGTHIAEENVEKAEEAPAEETHDNVVAEAGGAAETTEPETPTETPVETPAEEPVVSQETPATRGGDNEIEDLPATDAVETKKKTAEQMIAELAETVEKLQKEISELKEHKEVAETKSVTAEINPLMADIKPQKTYAVLEKVKTGVDYHSVLEKY